MPKTNCTNTEELAERLVEGISAFSRQMRLIALPPGMTRERLSLMSLIDEHGPVSVSDLAILSNVRTPTISRMTSLMVSDGLAKKVTQAADARGVLVTLTAKGRRTTRAANRKSADHVRRALEEVSPSEVAVLHELARKLEALDRQPRSLEQRKARKAASL